MKFSVKSGILCHIVVFCCAAMYYLHTDFCLAYDNNVDQNYLIKPTIAYVVDGDTIKIRLKERNTSVRLTGIDCYETSTNNHIKYQRNKGLTDDEIILRGYKAKDELTKILRKHEDIYLEITGVDHYSRLVGIFYYKDTKGKYININNEMMKTGYCPQYIYKGKS